MAAILTLLFARGHYSIDVVIAYWITTRIWWIYHTMANNPALMMDSKNKHNYLVNIWWIYIFRYFEGNVGRPLPKGFTWPWPKRLRQYRPGWMTRFRRRRRNSGDEERAVAATAAD